VTRQIRQADRDSGSVSGRPGPGSWSMSRWLASALAVGSVIISAGPGRFLGTAHHCRVHGPNQVCQSA
jgi:hypothetical protein